MDSKSPSTVPEAKKKSTRAKRFSPEEMCYLAHHVNQCHDFQDVCQMFNLHFGTERTLESIQKFFLKCDDDQFFDLTEQAQDYKWCTPHPMSPYAPPCMVLGTANWRTEIRAFLVFQALRNMTIAQLTESLNTTFPEESRTSAQIAAQLAFINKKQGLPRQLQWFAERYPWHPLYVAAASTSQASTEASKADAKAMARARLNKDKKKVAYTKMAGHIITPHHKPSDSTAVATAPTLVAATSGTATVNPSPATISGLHKTEVTMGTSPDPTPATTVTTEPTVELEKEKESEQEVVLDLDLELELFGYGPNRSVHRKFALCPANLP